MTDSPFRTTYHGRPVQVYHPFDDSKNLPEHIRSVMAEDFRNVVICTDTPEADIIAVLKRGTW